MLDGMQTQWVINPDIEHCLLITHYKQACFRICIQITKLIFLKCYGHTDTIFPPVWTVFLRVVWGDLKGVPMAARIRRRTTPTSSVTSTGITQNAATILKPLVPNPLSTLFTYGATCCWLDCTIPRSHHSSPPPLNSSIFPSPLRVRELVAFIMIIISRTELIVYCINNEMFRNSCWTNRTQ